MFWSRAHEALILSQRAEISDLRAALRAEREAFAAERKELVDRIIALSNPPVHRELHPRPPRLESLMDKPVASRIHFPGTGKQSFPVPFPSSRGPLPEAEPPAEETPS